MSIITDPNDPEFRKALRELGAPDWYPQDAPRHTVSGTTEQLEDGTWLSKLICPVCGWEKHFISGQSIFSSKSKTIKTINEGDRWAHHSGSTAPDLFQITAVNMEVVKQELPDEFEEFLKDLD